MICALLVAMALVPVLGVAGDDLSHRGSRQEAGLRHQTSWSWRTAPAALAVAVVVTRAAPQSALDAQEPQRPLLLLARTPFVPPRS
jgi:hypothetical protein